MQVVVRTSSALASIQVVNRINHLNVAVNHAAPSDFQCRDTVLVAVSGGIGKAYALRLVRPVPIVG